MTARTEKALQKVRKCAIDLKKRLVLPALADAQTEQGQALRHFLSRTAQLGEGSDLLCQADLDVPLMILLRVVCEDFFLCFWIARSEEDAVEYCRAVGAESLRLMRIMLENNRGVIQHKSTKENKTADVLRKLKTMNTDGFKIEQIAQKLGLTKVYDIVYRWQSMLVHGKSLSLELADDREKAIFSTVSALASLMEAIVLIADNRVLRGRATETHEVLQLLRIENVGGR
jgi:hypothetical protein